MGAETSSCNYIACAECCARRKHWLAELTAGPTPLNPWPACVPNLRPLQASLAATLVLRDMLVQLVPEAEASLVAATTAGGDRGRSSQLQHGLPALTPAPGGLAAGMQACAATPWGPGTVSPQQSGWQHGGWSQQGHPGEGEQQEQGASSSPAVPGILFKAAAVIREELVLCERAAHASPAALPGPAGCRGFFPRCAVLACTSNLPHFSCPPSSPLHAPSLPPFLLPPPPGHNMVSAVVDPSAGAEGMLVAEGVSEELDDLKALYYGLPDFLTQLVGGLWGAGRCVALRCILWHAQAARRARCTVRLDRLLHTPSSGVRCAWA